MIKEHTRKDRMFNICLAVCRFARGDSNTLSMNGLRFFIRHVGRMPKLAGEKRHGDMRAHGDAVGKAGLNLSVRNRSITLDRDTLHKCRSYLLANVEKFADCHPDGLDVQSLSPAACLKRLVFLLDVTGNKDAVGLVLSTDRVIPFTFSWTPRLVADSGTARVHVFNLFDASHREWLEKTVSEYFTIHHRPGTARLDPSVLKPSAHLRKSHFRRPHIKSCRGGRAFLCLGSVINAKLLPEASREVMRRWAAAVNTKASQWAAENDLDRGDFRTFLNYLNQ